MPKLNALAKIGLGLQSLSNNPATSLAASQQINNYATAQEEADQQIMAEQAKRKGAYLELIQKRLETIDPSDPSVPELTKAAQQLASEMYGQDPGDPVLGALFRPGSPEANKGVVLSPGSAYYKPGSKAPEYIAPTKAEGARTELGQLAEDLKSGMISQDQYNAAVRKYTYIAPAGGGGSGEPTVPGLLPGNDQQTRWINWMTNYESKKAQGEQTTPQEDYVAASIKRQLEMTRAIGNPESGFGIVPRPPLPEMAGGQVTQPATALPSRVGGPALKDVRAYNEEVKGLRTLSGTIDTLDGDLATNGMALAPGAQKKAQSTQFANLQSQLRILYNTGVLQPGELPFFERALANPTEWATILTSAGAGGVRAQLKELQRFVEFKQGLADESLQSISSGQPIQGVETKTKAPADMSDDELKKELGL